MYIHINVDNFDINTYLYAIVCFEIRLDDRKTSHGMPLQHRRRKQIFICRNMHIYIYTTHTTRSPYG